mmetsp:Transcript_19782/g.37126  ORF Transcript_19782/g.37126 Transcript_19782/m.37126 type:complete len:420 (+) Transcript_19782:52-1311(+)
MIAGCSTDLRTWHGACTLGIILACSYTGSSGTFSVHDLSDKESMCEATQYDEDDASLLQVKVSTKHQLDQVESGAASGDLSSKSAHGQRQAQHLNVTKMGKHINLEAYQLLRPHHAASEQPAALLSTRAGVVLGLLLLLCLTIFLCRADSGVSDPVTAEVLDQQSPLQRVSTPLETRPFHSKSSHGKQPFQGSPEFHAALPAPFNSPISSGALLSSGALQSSGPLEGLPLCPCLVVPDGTRLACVAQSHVCRTKQSLSFQVCSIQQRGGRPLFTVEVQELNAEAKPGIFLKALDGQETLASLSTEELWSLPEAVDDPAIQPALSIYRASGVLFGTVQRDVSGVYVIMRGQTCLATLKGNFVAHDLKAVAVNGREVASTQQISTNEYQVHVQSRVDAGLIILALLAADKLQGVQPAFTSI